MAARAARARGEGGKPWVVRASESLAGAAPTHECSHLPPNLSAQIMVWKELNYGSMREKEKQLVVSEVGGRKGSHDRETR